MNNLTNSTVITNETFFHKNMKIREKYKDVLETPDWYGLEIPKDEPSEGGYDNKIRTLWEKA